MSAAVENGVDASKPRGGVFSRAFAKRAQPYEEGESDDSSWSLPGRELWCYTRDFLPPGAWEDKHRVRFQVRHPLCKVFAGNSRHLLAYLGNGVTQSHRQNTHGVLRFDVHTITVINYMLIIYLSISRLLL